MKIVRRADSRFGHRAYKIAQPQSMRRNARTLFRRFAVAGDAAGEGAAGENFFTQLGGDLRVLLQESAGFFLALAEICLAVFEPGAGAVEDLLVQAQIEN